MSASKDLLSQLTQLIDDFSSAHLDSVESLAFSVAEDEEHRLCAYTMLCWGEAGISRLAEAAIVEFSPKKLSNIIRLLSAASSDDLSVGSMFSSASLPLVRKLSAAIKSVVDVDRARYFLCRVLEEGDAQELLGAMGICFSQFDQSEYAMIAEIVDAARHRWPKAH